MCARVRGMPATEAGVRRAAAEGAWAQQIQMDRYIPATGKKELTTSGMAAGASGGEVANRPPQWNKGQRTLPHNMSRGGAEQLTNPSSWGIQGPETARSRDRRGVLLGDCLRKRRLGTPVAGQEEVNRSADLTGRCHRKRLLHQVRCRRQLRTTWRKRW